MNRHATLLGIALSTLAACSSSSGSSSGGSTSGGSGGDGRTREQVITEAPLSYALTGTPLQVDRITFNVPPGWTGSIVDGVGIAKSPDTSACVTLVAGPQATPATEAEQYQSLLAVIAELYPQSKVTGEYGDAMQGRVRGTSGGGFSFVGMTLKIDGNIRAEPYLAMFGAEAVTVVQVQPAGANCLQSQKGHAQALEVFHSLTLAGFTPPAAPMAESVVGSWFSSDGSVGTLIVLGANHHYVDVSTMSGTIPAGPGLVREVTASWAGDGSYVSIGNVLARFPLATSKSPYSVLVRRFEQANTAQASGWLPTYCQLRRGTTSPFDPYEHCLTGGD